MTGGFEHRLEAGLEDLAAASEPPPPDLYTRVRARVDRRRRRRAAVFAGGVAACTATVLGLTLTFAGGSAPAPSPTVPASQGTATPSRGATTDTTWWPLADTALKAPPQTVVSVWDASEGTVHSDTRVLYRTLLSAKLSLFLVAGRTADGSTRTALLSGLQDTHGAVLRAGLSVLMDLAAPPDPTAPLALVLTQGVASESTSTLSVEVMATPCDGKEQLSLDGDSTPLLTFRDPNGVLTTKPLMTAGGPPAGLTLECGARAGITTVRLNPVGHAVVPGWDAAAYLLADT